MWHNGCKSLMCLVWPATTLGTSNCKEVVLMFDPTSRYIVQMRVRRVFAPARTLRRIFSRAAKQAKTTASPFKVGDYLAGDDPFNGSQEGVVAVIKGSTIGLRIVVPTGGTVVYYDYRQLRRPW